LSEAAPDPAVGKAGRNEGRKLAAAAVNNVGVAFLLAAVLQPARALVQQQRGVRLGELAASLIFLAIAAACFIVVRRVALRLED
jgi:hypothetical protein